jgi:hypothetical protein
MFQKKSVLGLSSAAVAWCAMASLVWAQASPGSLIVEMEVAGQPAGTARVLTWEDDRPDLIEIASPDGIGTTRKFLNADLWRSMVCLEGQRTRDGWWTGSVSLPTMARPLVYETRYRPLADGRTEIVVFPQGMPNDSVRAIMSGPGLAAGAADPNWLVPVLLVLIVIDTCAELQAEATLNCAEAAVIACGAGNVDEVEYTGVCGLGGHCRHSCD